MRTNVPQTFHFHLSLGWEELWPGKQRQKILALVFISQDIVHGSLTVVVYVTMLRRKQAQIACCYFVIVLVDIGWKKKRKKKGEKEGLAVYYFVHHLKRCCVCQLKINSMHIGWNVKLTHLFLGLLNAHQGMEVCAEAILISKVWFKGC